jgi:lipopolysaccharide biosynthesis protein
MDYWVENENVGFFFPDNLQVIKEHVEWGPNAPLIHSLLERADLPKVEIPKIAEFAAGSMAWFRTSAFCSFVSSFATSEDFDLEEGQLDTTIAHAIERAFPLVARSTRISCCLLLSKASAAIASAGSASRQHTRPPVRGKRLDAR